MTTGIEVQPQRLTPQITAVAALACGVAVACISLAQPLLVTIGDGLALGEGATGLIVAVTQIGYGAGLLLLVPLGDLVARPPLVRNLLLGLAGSLVLAGAAPTAPVLLVAMALIGVLAVVTQVIVAYVAELAPPEQRGRAVGVVTGGIVIGILLARTFAGAVAQVAGWRAVFLLAAAIVVAVAAALRRALPAEEAPRPRDALPYPALVRSTVLLVRDEPVLRHRALLALLTFTAFNLLWSGMALPLAQPPLELSDGAIGAFGLAGAAGALAAAPAGRLADAGRGRAATLAALALLTVAWLPIALLHRSLWALLAGVVLLDLAVQAVHVLSQARIYALELGAVSRVTAVYTWPSTRSAARSARPPPASCTRRRGGRPSASRAAW